VAWERFRREQGDAGRIALEAGALLLSLRAGELPGRELADEGDRRSQAFIAQALTEAYPADAILSEEAADDLARVKAERLWIVDPLDGSREFGERRPDWAVHVAFLYRNELAGGAVALPARGMTLTTFDPASLPATHLVHPRIMVSRTRPPKIATGVAEALGAALVPMGSAGYKSMAVVLGEAEAYIHAGGQYEWDLAAPAAVAMAAGLHVSRLDGSPLRFNQDNPWMPDVLICRPELAGRLLALLARMGGTSGSVIA
jgi:3'(2'), 5'-bisphosphate nucleotidase